MYSLIISLLAIALQAASLFSMMHYAPAWVKTAPDFTRSVAAGISSVEDAYYRYATVNAGAVPDPALGGLEQFQSPVPHLPFLPKAPEGFAWKYGFGAADYYVCLQAADGARPVSEGLFYGLRRLRKLFPDEQFVISAGAATCGSTLDIGEQVPEFPAPLSATYFLRYAPDMPPSSSVLPCSRNACLSAEVI